MFLAWDDAYDTGVDVIDHQHRRLVEYINALYTATVNHDSSGVSDVVDQLVEYTVGHFAYEEELLAQHDYAELEAHRAGHNQFADKIRGYQKRLQAGEDIADELLGELKDWLIGHIQSEDFAYVRTLSLPADAGKGTLSKMFGSMFN